MISARIFLEYFQAEDADRMIFGYLCFDHEEAGYFQKDDVSVGYIIADIISLYAFNRLNYTEYSNTFEKIKGSFSAQNYNLEKRFDEFLDKMLKAHSEKTVEKPTARNKLIPVDDIIMQSRR